MAITRWCDMLGTSNEVVECVMEHLRPMMLQEQLHPQPPQDEDGPQEHPHVRSHEHVHSVAQPQEGHHGQFKVSCEAQSQSASLLPPILIRPQEASASSYDMDMGDMGFDQNLHQV